MRYLLFSFLLLIFISCGVQEDNTQEIIKQDNNTIIIPLGEMYYDNLPVLVEDILWFAPNGENLNGEVTCRLLYPIGTEDENFNKYLKKRRMGDIEVKLQFDEKRMLDTISDKIILQKQDKTNVRLFYAVWQRE